MSKIKYADEKQSQLYKKFPSTHYLSNPKNVDHVLLWNTFFRRNLHRFAIDYLGIKLHFYQAIMLYFMGISQFFVTIATRSAAKSLILALYACCRCITRPETLFVLASSTKGQAKLLVTQKIQGIFMARSPALRKEIESIKDNQNEIIIRFRNNSQIIVVAALDTARGNRSTCLAREEFRQIKKSVDDSVLSPFQVIRQANYMTDDFYRNVPELQEEAVDIYISSSWLDDGHWMWNIVQQAFDGMVEEKPLCLLAFDESIVLKHNIKTMNQLKREKKKQDPLTWRIEYLNERVKENTHAFFSYDILAKNQRLKKAFYPRKAEDVKMHKKNPYEIPRQSGEVRIVSCDMAFITNKTNDNSIFSCIRLLPESTNYQTENKTVEIKNGYRRQLPYMESVQGGDVDRQALRIRQLYEDFGADYIVLDLRNAGISIYDKLAKVMYDDERDIEYAPLCCMNDDNVANRVKSVDANPVIFVISASQKLNSDIALSFKNVLTSGMIDLLVSYNTASEDILPNIPGYQKAVAESIESQLFFEKPYFETQELISETINLTYERKEQTGAIVISEQGSNRKDRYSSLSYGNYFASLLEQDLLSEDDNYDFVPLYN